MQLDDSRPRWGIFIVLFIILAALAAAPFFLFRSKAPLPTYEIQNFIGPVEVFSGEKRAWVLVSRGATLRTPDKIRTGVKGEVDIRVPDRFRIRVKENSVVEVPRPRWFEKELRYRLRLLKGSLLGSTEKEMEGHELEILTPNAVALIQGNPLDRGNTFQIQVNPETREASFRVLRGSIVVRSTKAHAPKSVIVHGLEKTEVKGALNPLEPTRVSRKEWDQMKEAYELIQKSAALEARQLDLSKEAGGLFEYVFDHGTFYTEKFGYAAREFFKDETTGKTRLEIEYDVFPSGSFVGVYLKTRKLDLSKFKALELQIRGDPQEGYPTSFRIEIKSGSSTVRLIVPRDFKEKWQTFKFLLHSSRPTPITEVTFVFSNDKVGTHKKGLLHLRQINLVPQDQALPKANLPAGTIPPS